MADEEQARKSMANMPSTSSHATQSKGAPMHANQNVEVKAGYSKVACLLGEFIGTCLLVFLGCGSCFTGPPWHTADETARIQSLKVNAPPQTSTNNFDRANEVQVALTFGVAVATIAQAIGHVSGCHLNPAVSFGLVAAGKFKLGMAFMYTAAQCAGATLAGVLLLCLWNGRDEFCVSWHPLKGQAIAAAILTEFVITFVLVLVVCGCCDGLRTDIKGSAPLAIGLAVTLGHLVGIRFSGASMNPARSFGPMLIGFTVTPAFLAKNVLRVCWVYWLGPIGGGVAAGLIYRVLFRVKG